MPALCNEVTDARGLLAAVLDVPGALSPQARLDVIQALCELAPEDHLPAFPATPVHVGDPAAALRFARARLRQAIPGEPDIDAVMRIAAAIACLDSALQTVAR